MKIWSGRRPKSMDDYLALKEREKEKINVSVPTSGRVPPMRSTDPLQKLIDICKEAECASPTDSAEEIQTEIDRLLIARGQLFDVERDAILHLTRKITELQDKCYAIEARQKFDGKYTTIDLDVLKWRDYRGLPQLVLFSLKSSRFAFGLLRNEQFRRNYLDGVPRTILEEYDRIAVSSNVKYGLTEPALPAQLASYYDDVCHHLEGVHRSGGHQPYASASFNGLIPPEIREKIREVQPLFEEIFLIASVVMEYREVKLPPAGDPIVAGWDGKNLYYIADFDTTAIEEAALLEGPARIKE